MVVFPSTLIVSDRWFSVAVVWATCSAHSGAARHDEHEQDEQDPEGDRGLVAPQATQPEPPRSQSVDVLPIGLLLPARGALKRGLLR